MAPPVKVETGGLRGQAAAECALKTSFSLCEGLSVSHTCCWTRGVCTLEMAEKSPEGAE
jgi:hypothetical protein